MGRGGAAHDRSPAARVAIVGGAVGGALAAATVATFVAELVWVVKRPLPSLVGLDPTGPIGVRVDTTPVRVTVLGDSSVTGPGLAHPDQVWIRRALGALAQDGSVELTSLAVGGSRSADVARQVDAALAVGGDLAVVAVGVNDAVHGTRPATFRRQLDDIVERLTTAYPAVAVASVGDLGMVARVPRPLSLVLRQRGRIIARTIAAVVADHERAHLLDVSAANDALRDRAMFGADLFHPGPGGHRAWADAVLPGLEGALAAAVAR